MTVMKKLSFFSFNGIQALLIFFSERFPFIFFDASNHSVFFLNIDDEFL